MEMEIESKLFTSKTFFLLVFSLFLIIFFNSKAYASEESGSEKVKLGSDFTESSIISQKDNAQSILSEVDLPIDPPERGPGEWDAISSKQKLTIKPNYAASTVYVTSYGGNVMLRISEAKVNFFAVYLYGYDPAKKLYEKIGSKYGYGIEDLKWSIPDSFLLNGSVSLYAQVVYPDYQDTITYQFFD
ncbi:hypothetical protein [Cytobacillus praedii]|uniref:hypothetical protein n=1 Tax=Cytobacillus praedii TaxID=1742358 RepID=UPI002E24361D|nr:hypothetical protein [Cytobacillus praedii]